MKQSLYIILGLVPVSAWSIFGIAALLVAPPIGAIVGLVLWGMYRATFNRNTAVKSQLFTCALLILGQAFLLFMLKGVWLGNNNESDEAFNYFVLFCSLGPLCVSTHFQLYTIYKMAFNK